MKTCTYLDALNSGFSEAYLAFHKVCVADQFLSWSEAGTPSPSARPCPGQACSDASP